MSNNIYPFDPTGTAASNLVTGEQHSVNEANYRDYFFIIPDFAPFFPDNFRMTLTTLDGETSILKEGEDFSFALLYLAATRSIGKPVYGGLSLNDNHRTGIITIQQYQSLGGEFVADSTTVLENLAEMVYNPRTTTWDLVTDKPLIFPPINHSQDFSNFYDEGELVSGLNSIAEAIAQRPAPIISLGGRATVENPTVDYYSIVSEQSDIYSGEQLKVAIFCDGTIVEPKKLFFTVWHISTSDSNFDITSTPVSVHQFNGEWSNELIITPENIGTDILEFTLQLRVGGVNGQIVAMSDAIRLHPAKVIIPPGTEQILVPTSDLGIAFNHTAKDTGFQSLNESEIETVVKNTVLDKSGISVNGVDNYLYHNFNFGKDGDFTFKLLENGTFQLENSGNLVLNSSNIATIDFVNSSVSTLFTAVQNYVSESATIPTTNLSGVISITQGGTGASNASAALASLGAYPASNPANFISAAQAPVLKVAGKTGNVSLNVSDIGNFPTKVSQFTNDSLFITSAGAPVQTVAGRTGNVVLSANDISGLSSVSKTGSYTDLSNTPTNLSEFLNDAGFITQFTAPVISVAGRTGSIILNTGDIAGLSVVAVSNDYNDLFNKPGNISSTGQLVNDAGYLVYTDTISKSDNIKGGMSGDIPYQTASDTTNFVAAGTEDQILSFKNSKPVWVNQESLILTVNQILNALGYAPIDSSLLGAPNGVATLGENGKLVSTQIPLAIDDVEEYTDFASLPPVGLKGTLYIIPSTDPDTNKPSTEVYRWSGSSYFNILLFNGSTDSVPEGNLNLYFTNERASNAAPVQTVAGRTGNIVLSKSDIGDLPTSALTGNYADLENKPAIPSKVSELTNDSNFITIADVAVKTVAGRTGNVVLTQNDISGLTTSSSPVFDSVQANNFVGALSGVASSADNIVGGNTFSIPCQISKDVTGFIPNGTAGQILQSNGDSSKPTWIDPLAIASVLSVAGKSGHVDLTQNDIIGLKETDAPTFAGVTATTFTGALTGVALASNNIVGGSANSLVFQSGENSTNFITPGNADYILKSNGPGSAPTWVDPSALFNTSANADSINGGSVYSIPYQNGINSTIFLAPGIDGQILQTKGTTSAPIWIDPSSLVLGLSQVTNALGYVPVSPSILGAANGIATLGADGKLKTSQIPGSLLGANVYQGVWNASTNSPALASGIGTKGYYYKVSVAGTTGLDGNSGWQVGDYAIFNGTTWDWIDGGSSEVTTVAGRVGAIVLSQADISGLTTSSSPTFAAVTAATFTGALAGNASSATTATYLSATQQINIITGKNASMAMAQDATANGSFVCRSQGTGDSNLAGIVFWNDSYAIKLGVRADGYFGLGGWSRAAWSWYSDPSGNMVAAGNVTAYSDPRLKDNVKVIENAIDILDQINGVTFTWNNRSKLVSNKAGKRDYGILANEVKSVMPEIISQSIKDEELNEIYDTVSYEKLVPVLIQAIKEINKELKDCKAEIASLKEKM